MHIVLNASRKTVHNNGYKDLHLHSVFRGAPELLASEVLLQPLEGQLDLPAVLVELGDQQGRKADGIGQEPELESLFLVPVPNEPQLFQVVLRAIISRQLYLGIRKDVLW